MVWKGLWVAKLWTALLVASLVSGCAQWQRDGAKTRADFQNYREGARERAAYDSCAEKALPGSVENLECRLRFTKKEQKPPKQ
jgi:hypothetical protein